MNYNNSDIDSTISYIPYKNAIDNNIDLFPNTTINEYTDMKYVYEHFFEVYDPFLLNHSCRESLLVKCANCSDIFCNGCGKGINHSYRDRLVKVN